MYPLRYFTLPYFLTSNVRLQVRVSSKNKCLYITLLTHIPIHKDSITFWNSRRPDFMSEQLRLFHQSFANYILYESSHFTGTQDRLFSLLHPFLGSGIELYQIDKSKFYYLLLFPFLINKY